MGRFKERRKEKKAKRAAARSERQQKRKEKVSKAAQVIEDTWDKVWQGETDKDKEIRLAEEKEEFESQRDMIFKYVLVFTIAGVALFTIPKLLS